MISHDAFPKFRINNIPALVQIMTWRRPGDQLLSGPRMVSLLTHIRVTRPQWGVTGPLCGELNGHRWIPCTKSSDAELWCFLWSSPGTTIEQTMETPVIWDAIGLIITSFWCSFNRQKNIAKTWWNKPYDIDLVSFISNPGHFFIILKQIYLIVETDVYFVAACFWGFLNVNKNPCFRIIWMPHVVSLRWLFICDAYLLRKGCPVSIIFRIWYWETGYHNFEKC